MRDLVKATLVTWVAGVVGLLAAVFRSKIMAVTIGPAGVGIVAQLFTFVTFMGGVGSLYLGSGVAQHIARFTGEGNANDVRRVVQSGLALVALASLLLTLGALVLAPRLVGFVLADASVDVGLFRLASLSVLFVALVRHLDSVYSGLGVASLTSANHVVTALVTATLSVLFVSWWGIEGAVGALTLSHLVTLIVQIILLRSQSAQVFDDVPRYLDRRALGVILPPLLRIGAVSFIMGSADSAAALLIRSRIIGLYGVTANGLYQGAVAASTQVIGTSMAFVASYALARVNSATTSEERTTRTNQAFHIGLIVVTAAVSLLSFSRRYYAHWLLSPEFSRTALYFPLQAIGEGLKQLGLVLGMAVLLTAGVRRWLILGLSRALSSLVWALVLLPLGERTLAAPDCLSGLGYFAFSYWIVARSDGFRLTHHNKLASFAALPLVGSFLLASLDVLWLILALPLAFAWAWFVLGEYRFVMRNQMSICLHDFRRRRG